MPTSSTKDTAKYVMFGGGKHKVHTGPRGGKYLVSKDGKKRYI